MKKLLVLFGSRSDVSSLAPVVKALRKFPEEFGVISALAGCQCDGLRQELSALGIEVEHDLGFAEAEEMLFPVTVKVLNDMQEVLVQEMPDMLLVSGNTTAALAGALAAYYQEIPAAHVGAGLRSHRKYDPFPKEMNGRLLAHLVDLHFVQTERAKENLLREGVSEQDIYVMREMEDAVSIVRSLRMWFQA